MELSVPLIAAFVMGVVNFAVHRGVMRSGHRLVEDIGRFTPLRASRITYATEFLILVLALLLAAHDWTGAVWAYAAYTAMNLMAAWMILSNRL